MNKTRHTRIFSTKETNKTHSRITSVRRSKFRFLHHIRQKRDKRDLVLHLDYCSCMTMTVTWTLCWMIAFKGTLNIWDLRKYLIFDYSSQTKGLNIFQVWKFCHSSPWVWPSNVMGCVRIWMKTGQPKIELKCLKGEPWICCTCIFLRQMHQQR